MTTVLVLLGLGVLAARLPALPARAPDALDWLVLWVALPGLVLAELPGLDLEPAALVPVAAAWGTVGLLAVAVLLVGRARGWTRRTLGTMLLLVPLGNTSFLGIPAVEALLGADHLPYALVYDQLGSFPALATWGSLVVARYGAGSSPSVGATARRLLTFPPFVAVLAAFAVRAVGIPDVAADVYDDVTGRLGAMVTPLAMIAVGMRLRLPSSWGLAEPLAVGLVLRLGLAPAAVVGAAWLLGADGAAWDTSVVEAAMPSMVTASVVATASGLDEELSVGLVGAGVLAAMVTAPWWAGIVTG